MLFRLLKILEFTQTYPVSSNIQPVHRKFPRMLKAGSSPDSGSLLIRVFPNAKRSVTPMRINSPLQWRDRAGFSPASLLSPFFRTPAPLRYAIAKVQLFAIYLLMKRVFVIFEHNKKLPLKKQGKLRIKNQSHRKTVQLRAPRHSQGYTAAFVQAVLLAPALHVCCAFPDRLCQSSGNRATTLPVTAA